MWVGLSIVRSCSVMETHTWCGLKTLQRSELPYIQATNSRLSIHESLCCPETSYHELHWSHVEGSQLILEDPLQELGDIHSP